MTSDYPSWRWSGIWRLWDQLVIIWLDRVNQSFHCRQAVGVTIFRLWDGLSQIGPTWFPIDINVYKMFRKWSWNSPSANHGVLVINVSLNSRLGWSEEFIINATPHWFRFSSHLFTIDYVVSIIFPSQWEGRRFEVRQSDFVRITLKTHSEPLDLCFWRSPPKSLNMFVGCWVSQCDFRAFQNYGSDDFFDFEKPNPVCLGQI